MSAWIKMISDEDADEELTSALDEARTPHGTVDNVLRVHSLRPATMRGHIHLYRSILHHPDNLLSSTVMEAAGTYTSLLNGCQYSVIHHGSNLRRLLDDDERYKSVMTALETDQPEHVFEGKELAMLRYVRKLTTQASEMERQDYDRLVRAGCVDEEIFELNQIVGYFCYVNRLLNGLGVTTDGDVIGYY